MKTGHRFGRIAMAAILAAGVLAVAAVSPAGAATRARTAAQAGSDEPQNAVSQSLIGGTTNTIPPAKTNTACNLGGALPDQPLNYHLGDLFTQFVATLSCSGPVYLYWRVSLWRDGSEIRYAEQNEYFPGGITSLQASTYLCATADYFGQVDYDIVFPTGFPSEIQGRAKTYTVHLTCPLPPG